MMVVLSGPVPDALRDSLALSPFYAQHVDVHGLPILASARVNAQALDEAAWLIEHMIGHRPDVLQAMAKAGTRFVVMSVSEYTTDIPEHQDLYPRFWWDVRARGLGATDIRPAVTCGEENLLALDGDPYATENILIHEFAHAIQDMGLVAIDPTFNGRLKQAYDDAIAKGLWVGTYAATNHREYWAEGVQSWFDTNRSDDDQHNGMDTRDELRMYDPGLAALCSEIFGDGTWKYVNPRRRLPGTPGTEHLAEFDRVEGRSFHWTPSQRAAYEAENERRATTARRPGEPTLVWLRRRCAANCPDAMLDLGCRFRDGEGVDKDHALARRWFARAAIEGYPPALDHLGWLQWQGDQSVRDLDQARFNLERAARAGHVQAMLNMARFDTEQGAASRADRWWRMAAEHGHPEALGRVKSRARTVDKKDDTQ